MESLFNKLHNQLSENEKIDILLRNLQPQYSLRVTQPDLLSIPTLLESCKFTEKLLHVNNHSQDYFNTTPSPSKINKNTTNPNYQPYIPPFPYSINAVNTNKPSPTSSQSQFSCPRCRNNSHTLQNCTNPQKVCFRCGNKGYTALNCPKCTKTPKLNKEEPVQHNNSKFDKQDWTNWNRLWKAFNIAPNVLHKIASFQFPKTTTFLINKTQESKIVNSFKNLTESQQITANLIIEKFKNISTDTKPLGRTHLVEHRIDTGDHPPIKQRCYRLSPEKQKALHKEVDDMVRLDVIEPCESPWLNPLEIGRPSEHRNSIIAQNHCTPTAAHFGTFKTYHRIKLNYFWPGMYKDVATFISRCDTCLAYKHRNQNAIGLMGEPKQCSRPFQCLSIDFIGPLPISRKLNRYILVITCCFSKYCLLFPIKRATSSVIKHVLEDLVFMNYGIPETVILDNGPQMTSSELTDMFHPYKIPHIHFIPLHCPQVNTVERYNRTIITAVASFVNDDHRTWDKHLHKIQFAINSSVNESTKFTPAFLVFGRELVPCGSTYSQRTPRTTSFLLQEIYMQKISASLSPFLIKYNHDYTPFTKTTHPTTTNIVKT
ncbi:integrase core domain-containing protein [Phthorimaea operculella]|nr:integrase core domain-containing protein [Phthorimaea operculella]